jgi:CarboxypepD_reg-like domain
MHRNQLFILLLLTGITATAQSVKVYGKITNARMEPLAFVSLQVKEYKQGIVTKEDGTYELELEEGKYELVASMVGYKTQIVTIIIGKINYKKDIIMEAGDVTNLSEVTVKGKFKDRAEDYIRNVIRGKEAIEAAAGAYSCNVYIKAIQEDSMAFKKPKKKVQNDSVLKIQQANAELNRMALAEIVLRLDRESARRIKEERIGITKKGNAFNLFFFPLRKEILIFIITWLVYLLFLKLHFCRRLVTAVCWLIVLKH